MGAKLTTVDKRFAPSPSAYSITQYSVGVNGSKWGFGTEKRKGVASGSLSPGPGAYQTKTKAFDIEKPRFFMGEKIKDLKPNTTVPGAGQYDPNGSAIKKQLPSYSMK